MKSSSAETAGQAWRFIVVGVINTAIDLAVLNLLLFTIGSRLAAHGMGYQASMTFWYACFKSVSFIFAAANSYLLHRYWTFSSTGKNKKVHRQAGQFLAVSLVGLGVNVAAATLFVSVVPVLLVSRALWPSVGALFGTACGLGVNFFGYKLFVFAGGDGN